MKIVIHRHRQLVDFLLIILNRIRIIHFIERFGYLFDSGIYETFKTPAPIDDPLRFQAVKTYKDQLKSARKKTGMDCGMMVVSGSSSMGRSPQPILAPGARGGWERGRRSEGKKQSACVSARHV